MASIQRSIDTELLLRTRLGKGWTQRQVVNRCNELGKDLKPTVKVYDGNYSRYESGQLLPAPATLLLIAQALDLTVDQLLITQAA